MTIVLCSKGYPEKYKNNIKLNNLNSFKLSKKDYIFHAGTKLLNNEVVSNGGRVLNITSTEIIFRIRKRIITILKN